MIKKTFRYLIFSLFFLSFFLTKAPTPAQGEGQRYFPETGHWVEGDFLTTFLSVPDPLKVYGYPITDQFYNETTGRQVQYFQRAYFELHPENPPELRVQLSLLGQILYPTEKGEELSIPDNFPACRSFSETGRQVCYAFLDFFDANGGVPQFGYPISNIEIRDGRMVQFFQRAEFEWRPDLPPGERVVLADLGLAYFKARNEDPGRIDPIKNNYAPQSILSLQVRAFVGKAVMPLKGSQYLYVIVQDQNRQPVTNAQVLVTVDYPSGNEARFVMPLTDSFGITKVQFPVEEITQGIVSISVEVSYDKLVETTRTSFRLWW